MTEYIERDKRMDIDTLQNWFIDSIDETTSPCSTVEHLKELLNDFIVIPIETPTADVRPERHGEWFFEAPNAIGHFPVKCSCCGTKIATTADPCSWKDEPNHIYCGNCGAKMDGKDV